MKKKIIWVKSVCYNCRKILNPKAFAIDPIKDKERYKMELQLGGKPISDGLCPKCAKEYIKKIKAEIKKRKQKTITLCPKCYFLYQESLKNEIKKLSLDHFYKNFTIVETQNEDECFNNTGEFNKLFKKRING